MKRKIIFTLFGTCICIVAFSQLTIGLPKAVLYNKAGNAISTSSISDFDNPIIVVTYAVSWCKPCVQFIDELERNYSTLGGVSQVKIVAINVESGISASTVFDHARRWSRVEVLNDRDNAFMKAMYTSNAPKIFFLDGNQQVVYCHEKNGLDVKKAYTLINQIKRKEITADNQHFDKDWFPCPPASSIFYRKLSKKTNGNWQVDDYFKNGKPQMSGEAIVLEPLVRQGRYTYYFENGNPSSEEYYEKNILEGSFKNYHESGGLKEEFKYANGKIDGSYVAYHKNGRKAIEGNYKYGNAEGLFKYFYNTGKKRKELIFANNKMNGKAIGWHPDGKLKYEAYFDYDVLLEKPLPVYYHENGKPGIELKVSETGNGGVKYFYNTGNLMAAVESVDDLLEVTQYYPSGKLKLKATMSDEETVNGKYILWYENGQKSVEATYFGNKPSGKAMAWYADGKPKEKIDYDAGTSEYFDESGNKVSSLSKYSISIKKGEYLETGYLTDIIYMLSDEIKADGTTLE